MQSNDVISVNLWQILISLSNLAILFFILKKLLFKPIRNMLEERQKIINDKFSDAEYAVFNAQENEKLWELKMLLVEEKAQELVQAKLAAARLKSEHITAEAKEKADSVIRRAHAAAELERHRSESEIKHKIADISAAMAEKILAEKLDEKSHRAIIDSFICELEDKND